MKPISGFSVIRFSLLITSLYALNLCTPVFASKVTIDADGTANYSSLDVFIDSLQAKKIDPDTVFFSGNNQHTYTWSKYLDVTTVGTIVFIGNINNPDSFPVINRSGNELYGFFGSTTFRFERIIFTGAIHFNTGSGGQNKIFSRCIIRGYTSKFMNISGNQNTIYRFENCLFANNTSTDGLFTFDAWGGQPAIQFVNCTFDNNVRVLGSIPSGVNLSSVVLKNCIFSGGTSYIADAAVKAKVVNSLTSDASGYTASCIYSAEPGYTVVTRTKPSDFKLPDTSRAKGIADTSGAPATDIGNRLHGITNGKADAGCWAIVVGGGAEITADPKDTTIAVGSVVRFSVTAKGTEKIHYYWYRNGVVVSGNDSSVYTFTCSAENNGLKISCKVDNGLGTDSSKAALLTVRTKPSAMLTDSVITASEGDSAVFSVTATGGGITYQWFKNGVKLPGDTFATLTFTTLVKADSGKYSCFTSNIAGTDTVEGFLHVLGAEPHISLEPKDTTVVEGGTAIFLVASTGKNLTYAWYKESNITVPGNTAQLALTNLKPENSGKYYCVVSNSFGKDTSESATLTVTASQLKNPLQIGGVWNGNNSFKLKLSGFNQLSSDSVGYVTVNCTKNSNVLIRDSIYAADIKSGVDTIVQLYTNDLFAGEQTSITWMVQITNKQGKQSNIVQDSFTVGYPRTMNHAKITVTGISKNSITLNWSIPSQDQIDSIRIWYGKDSIGMDPSASVVKPALITKQCTADTSVTLSDLENETLYYIAIQVHKTGCLWSYTAESGKTKAKTADLNTFYNTIKVSDVTFDSLTNLINVSWSIDTTGRSTSKLITGITWGLGGYVLTKPFKVILPASVNKYQADLGENLMFDTTYYFALWLGQINNADTLWWDPVEYSKDSVVISSPVFQKITYFEQKKNIAYALSRNVILQAGAGYNDPAYTDTVSVFKPTAQQITDGLIPVSLGIDFLHDYSTDALSLSIQYDMNLIPVGSKATDIRMYEFDAAKNSWNFIDNVIVDTTTRVVKKSVQNLNELSKPLMLMIDKKEPVITITSDTSSFISAGDAIVTTCDLNDNIQKLRVSLVSCSISGRPDTIKDTLTDAKSFTFSIPKEYSYKDFGLKAIISISDGRYTKKIDISRSVRDSIEVTADPMKWKPVYSNLTIDKPYVPDVFKSLCKGEWNYDSVQFRIFTWGDSLNKPGARGWQEYSSKPEVKDMFSLIPGRVLWVKVRESIHYSCGAGNTVPLKEPYKNIVLKSKNWTDISLPYKFNTFLNDIIDSTAGTDSQLRQVLMSSLLFYSWESNGSVYNPVHNPVNLDENKPDTFLDYTKTYSVYNMNNNDVTLKVPAISEDASHYNGPSNALAKKSSVLSWGVSLKAHSNDETLQSVYFGYTEGAAKITVPQPPSFSRIRISLLDNSSNRQVGTLLTNENSGNGYSVPVIFENRTENAESIVYNIKKVASFPENYKVVLADPQSNNENGSEITIAPQKSASRILLIGDDEFIAKQIVQLKPAEFALVKMFPNPCRTTMQIRFTLPYAGIKRLNVAIFDQMGRTVWTTKLEKGLRAGSVNTLYWNPKKNSVVSGIYSVRITAINDDGTLNAIRQQRVIYIP